MNRMLPAGWTELPNLQPLGLLLILIGVIVPILALSTGKR